MEKKDKYTVEEIKERLDGMMEEISGMMERCDERDKIGLIYSFAHTEGGLSQIRDSMTVMDAHFMSDWFGWKLMCASALIGFQRKYQDIAEVASMAQTIDTKKIFGI